MADLRLPLLDAALASNHAHLERAMLSHLGRLLARSIEDALERSEIVVVTKRSSAVDRLGVLLRDDQALVDLVGLPTAATLPKERYAGIGWP